ncbi:MAG: hypothetical protein A2020_10565 [Lentisphaerae bacterium GWF2_45_14]|nr:MAG: hypothetical protein A2020_10565 [Lentisphaerae bacterium GWF2_45_14]
MRIILEKYTTECPYLDNKTWAYSAFRTFAMAPAVYEYLIGSGWRRSGLIFYQNSCPGCSECRPIRINVEKFRPDRSQSRNIRRNSDIICSVRPFAHNHEEQELYNRYVIKRHEQKLSGADVYAELFADSPVQSMAIKYYLGPRLAAVGWMDIMPESISSIYLAYDPDFSSRGLGVFSILKQIELCRFLGKKSLHLGFHVKDSKKMCYKSKFKSAELLIDEQWSPIP